MGKATEALRELSDLPPRSEDERLGGALPSLKLKPERTAEVSQPAKIAEGLAALARKDARNVLVRDSASGLEGVLVPVERYVELVGRELQSSRLRDTGPDGRLVPSGLADADVEMIDPAADWPSG